MLANLHLPQTLALMAVVMRRFRPVIDADPVQGLQGLIKYDKCKYAYIPGSRLLEMLWDLSR
jgi:hypothetical protein